MGQVDGRAHKALINGIPIHVADKALVDLDQVDRELFELARRDVTRPEVVQGDGNAQLAQLGKRCEPGERVARQERLAHLETNELGWQSDAIQELPDLACQARVGELAGRKIDMDPDPSSIQPVPRLLGGLFQDPAAHGLGQVALLDPGEEVARHQESVARVLPAHQGFHPDDSGGRQTDDGLVEQIEFAALQGLAKLEHPLTVSARTMVRARLQDGSVGRGTLLGDILDGQHDTRAEIVGCLGAQDAQPASAAVGLPGQLHRQIACRGEPAGQVGLGQSGRVEQLVETETDAGLRGQSQGPQGGIVDETNHAPAVRQDEPREPALLEHAFPLVQLAQLVLGLLERLALHGDDPPKQFEIDLLDILQEVAAGQDADQTTLLVLDHQAPDPELAHSGPCFPRGSIRADALQGQRHAPGQRRAPEIQFRTRETNRVALTQDADRAPGLGHHHRADPPLGHDPQRLGHRHLRGQIDRVAGHEIRDPPLAEQITPAQDTREIGLGEHPDKLACTVDQHQVSAAARAHAGITLGEGQLGRRGERIRRHPLAQGRAWIIGAAGEERERVALGEDADRVAGDGQHDRADPTLAHRRDRQPERILGGEDEGGPGLAQISQGECLDHGVTRCAFSKTDDDHDSTECLETLAGILSPCLAGGPWPAPGRIIASF